jgi:phage terminase large subunit GpA-like protein
MADLETLIFDMRFPVDGAPGHTMGIWRAAIDTGGGKSGSDDDETSRTEEVYEWLRKHAKRGVVFGIKGASHKQIKRVQVTTIDKMPRSSKPIPGGLELRLLDTDQFKYTLHWRLERVEGETQCFYLHAETSEDYATEFLAEEVHRDRHGRTEWRRVRQDNHYLDCEVYAAACADAEWFPSISMVANILRQKKEHDAQRAVAASTSAPAAEPGRRPAVPSEDRDRPSWLESRR